MIKLSDIAKELNLSLTTVSRALNNYSDVSPKTRKLVIETAKRLGYIPNLSARGLALRKNHLVSLFYYDYVNAGPYQPFTFEVIAGIRKFFSNTSYDLIMIPETRRGRKPESLKNICYSRGIDGLIILGILTDDPYLEELRTNFIPAVFLDYPMLGKKTSYVESDNIRGCKLAIDYLVSQGHTRIAFINGHDLAAVSPVRLKGYKEGLEKHNIEYDPEIVEIGDYTERSGYIAARNLLLKKKGITAIFAASDLMAIGAIRGLSDIGLKVPDDVAVVGFDDILLAEYFQPRLTTIRQHKFELGFQAAAELHCIMEKAEYTPRVRRIKVELIIRDSA